MRFERHTPVQLKSEYPPGAPPPPCSNLIGKALPYGHRSISQPNINVDICQPNFNHFSTLTFQLQTWLIFGWIVVEKLIFGWPLFQNQRFLNQISTLRMVEESWGSTLLQRWFNVEKLICAHWVSKSFKRCKSTHFEGKGGRFWFIGFKLHTSWQGEVFCESNIKSDVPIMIPCRNTYRPIRLI